VPDDRRRAYREAIRSAAPGRVVLDIGTGRDALWAIEAARSGARHAYAVEAHPETAQRAERAVAAAGFAHRVTVLPGPAGEQTLPVRAEVCVSEIVGNIASAEGAIAVLADARSRLCTAGCLVIPFRMQTWVAAVDLGPGDPPLAAESLRYLHAVFAAAGHPFDLRLCLAGPAAEALISSAAPVESAVFDRRRPAPPAGEHTVADLRIDVSGARMTGLLLWARVAAAATGREIDALTGGGRGWAPVYVPLDPGPVPVGQGARIRVAFTRATSDDGVHPDYEVTVDDRTPWRSTHHGWAFRATALHRSLFPETGPASG